MRWLGDEILLEIQKTPGNYDAVRRKYLDKLFRLTAEILLLIIRDFLTVSQHPIRISTMGICQDS